MKVKLGPEDPLVKEALSGVYRSSCRKLFFRIEDGEHRKVSVARELAHLDITHDNRKSLVRSYQFEQLPYASERMKAKAAAKSKQPRPKLVLQCDGAHWPIEPGGSIVEDGDSYDDFAEEQELPEEEIKNVSSRLLERYSLVETNNGLWGCYDGSDGGLTLFHTKAEANAFINELLHGGNGFKPFYGGNN